MESAGAAFGAALEAAVAQVIAPLREELAAERAAREALQTKVAGLEAKAAEAERNDRVVGELLTEVANIRSRLADLQESQRSASDPAELTAVHDRIDAAEARAAARAAEATEMLRGCESSLKKEIADALMDMDRRLVIVDDHATSRIARVETAASAAAKEAGQRAQALVSQAQTEAREAVAAVRRGAADKADVDEAIASVERRLTARVDQQVGRVLIEMDARHSRSEIGQLVS
jgi:hypothetical protein